MLLTKYISGSSNINLPMLECWDSEILQPEPLQFLTPLLQKVEQNNKQQI